MNTQETQGNGSMFVPESEGIETLLDQEPAQDTSPPPRDGRQPGVPVIVRQHTREVFDALRAAGEMPSVRKLHAQLGGSYNRLVEELRVLREEGAVGLPPLPDERAPVGQERDGMLLMVTPRAADALEKMRQALREDTRLYHDVVLALRKVQLSHTSVLTDLLAAWVGKGA